LYKLINLFHGLSSHDFNHSARNRKFRLGGNVGFEVLTVVNMRNSVFWGVTPRSPVKVHRLHRKKMLVCHLLFVGFFLDNLLDPEDLGDMLLLKVA
jgi:hypothetical protein